MNNEDAMETYAELATILREFALDWIVEQVEDDIRTGKAEQKRATVSSDRRQALAENWRVAPPSSAKIPRRKPTREEEFTALRDFSATERLEILIDATDRALQGAANLESQLLSMKVLGSVRIVLAGEEADNVSRSLDAQQTEGRLQSVHRLSRALAALRLELRDGH
jgi:phage gp29-like protein